MAISTIKTLEATTETRGIVSIQKYGKVRVVTASGEIANQTIATQLDKPLVQTNALGRYRHTANNTYYPALFTISTAGTLSASYFNGTSVTGSLSGNIVGTITYITE